MKRILLFIATNILVMLMLTLVIAVTGLGRYITPYGLDLGSLAVFSLVIGFTGAGFSLLISKWMAKAFMGVRVVNPNSADPYERWLVQTVYRQAQSAGLKKMPEVGIYDSEEVNAFATGPSKSNSLVAVSTGLLRRMNHDGVEGVLGHEVSHIANGDMVTMTLLQGVINTFVVFLARVISFFAAQAVRSELAGIVHIVCIIVLQIVFGLMGSLVVMAYSRHREFKADAGGAALASREKMISGLEQLRTTLDLVDKRQSSFTSLKISSGAPGWLKAFSSHPDLEERIARLRAA